MRDELSQLAADNIRALMAAADRTPNKLQTRVNEMKLGEGRGSIVTDFLKRNSESSISLRKLADLAAALGVAPIGLLLPPDKRRELLAALDILGTLGPEEIDQATRAIVGFFQSATPQATDESPGADKAS